MEWLFFGGMIVARILFGALVVLIVVRIARGGAHRRRAWWLRQRQNRAIDRLGARFAAGEIDEAEFRARRAVLAENGVG